MPQASLKVSPKVFTDSELAGISLPVFLLLGEKEVCCNPYKAAERARRAMPKISVAVVSNAGHMLIMECPDLVNSCILEFLRHGLEQMCGDRSGVQ
jgi:pimeloyl-ACP methyl ester carboxylesterase